MQWQSKCELMRRPNLASVADMNLMDRWLELLIVVGLGLLPIFIPAVGSPETLMKHVQEAWRVEVGAQRRYAAFAMRADAEGCGEAASLFRAFAKAEGVHAAAHLQILEASRGTLPDYDDRPAVGSTLANLEEVRREFQERSEIYTRFLDEHEADENQAAIRVFALARAAETRSAVLCGELLRRKDALLSSEPRAFYVCPLCGYITEARTFANCPSCFKPVIEFVRVS